MQKERAVLQQKNYDERWTPTCDERFWLENLNLDKTGRGAIKVNEKMQTSLFGVYVCGDLTGFSLLAHTAVREAEVAVHSILGKEDAMSYQAIPGVVYTNWRLQESEKRKNRPQQKELLIRWWNFWWLIPVVLVAGEWRRERSLQKYCWMNRRIIGAHVLGNPASEIITLAGFAIELGLTAAAWKKIVSSSSYGGEIFREAL